MSLLMDALKKAELAKRKAQPDNPAPSTPSASAAAMPQSRIDNTIVENRPSPAIGDDAAHLPNLPDHLEFLDHEFDTAAAKKITPSETPAPVHASAISSPSSLTLQTDDPPQVARKEPTITAAASPAEREREAVQNLFGTKQAAPSRRLFAIAVGVATLCAIGAIGLYFWIELQPKSGLQMAHPIVSTAQSTPILSSNSRVTPALPLLPVAPTTLPTAITGLPFSSPSPADRQAPAVENIAPEMAPPVRQNKKLFQLSTSPPSQPSQALDRAYNALARGDAASAKTAYAQVLNVDPKNADALAGLAVVAQKSGNDEAAADYYLQMLDADPKNAIAMAGLMNLQSRMDPVIAETRLKQALSSQPDSAALNFSLGNIYSRGKRWNDAQQAYFKAVAGDPGNPDYLFNLAVSLDQIRQPKLAEKYYTQAIDAAQIRPAGFDKARVTERLQKLQQQP